MTIKKILIIPFYINYILTNMESYTCEPPNKIEQEMKF